MSEILKLDIEKMETELEILSESIETFRIFAEKAFEDEIQLLEGMNSDFISKLKKVFNNMQDDNTQDLIKKLDEYYDLGQSIVKQFDEHLDKAMAKQIG